MEHILVWITVLLASLYLIGHFRAQFKTKQGCGSCKNCPAASLSKKTN